MILSVCVLVLPSYLLGGPSGWSDATVTEYGTCTLNLTIGKLGAAARVGSLQVPLLSSSASFFEALEFIFHKTRDIPGEGGEEGEGEDRRVEFVKIHKIPASVRPPARPIRRVSASRGQMGRGREGGIQSRQSVGVPPRYSIEMEPFCRPFFVARPAHFLF